MMQTMPQWNGEWSPFAGRRPALGYGVPGRRPARRCPFGIVCILARELLAQEHEQSILEDAVGQAYSLDSL